MTSQYYLILKMCHMDFIYKYIFNKSYAYLSWFTLTSKWHLVTHSYGSSLRGTVSDKSNIYPISRYLYRIRGTIGFIALKTSVYPLLSNHALRYQLTAFHSSLLPKKEEFGSVTCVCKRKTGFLVDHSETLQFQCTCSYNMLTNAVLHSYIFCQ